MLAQPRSDKGRSIHGHLAGRPTSFRASERIEPLHLESDDGLRQRQVAAQCSQAGGGNVRFEWRSDRSEALRRGADPRPRSGDAKRRFRFARTRPGGTSSSSMTTRTRSRWSPKYSRTRDTASGARPEGGKRSTARPSLLPTSPSSISSCQRSAARTCAARCPIRAIRRHILVCRARRIRGWCGKLRCGQRRHKPFDGATGARVRRLMGQ